MAGNESHRAAWGPFLPVSQGGTAGMGEGNQGGTCFGYGSHGSGNAGAKQRTAFPLLSLLLANPFARLYSTCPCVYDLMIPHKSTLSAREGRQGNGNACRCHCRYRCGVNGGSDRAPGFRRDRGGLHRNRPCGTCCRLGWRGLGADRGRSRRHGVRWAAAAPRRCKPAPRRPGPPDRQIYPDDR